MKKETGILKYNFTHLLLVQSSVLKPCANCADSVLSHFKKRPVLKLYSSTEGSMTLFLHEKITARTDHFASEHFVDDPSSC